MLEVENQTPAPFRLQVLGGAWLESGTTSPVTLERKVAALLTLLALEGPTTRSRMAGLLWADRLEDVARSNLRQCLRRLRNLTGTELVGADDTLRLVPDLRVDALRLESLVFTGEYAPALELEGVLLAGLEYDDCPEFEEWLHSTRDRLENARREALSAEADRLEHEGNLVAALGLASRLLERDPLSEGAHRRVMRLHYLQGDRSSALAAFDRCCKT
jgi:DNA-binding SARP family transcriptional activator